MPPKTNKQIPYQGNIYLPIFKNNSQISEFDDDEDH